MLRFIVKAKTAQAIIIQYCPKQLSRIRKIYIYRGVNKQLLIIKMTNTLYAHALTCMQANNFWIDSTK